MATSLDFKQFIEEAFRLGRHNPKTALRYILANQSHLNGLSQDQRDQIDTHRKAMIRMVIRQKRKEHKA